MPRPAFNANMAVLYGRFVQAAYTMYGNNPNNPTPPLSNDFPAGYQLTAWIQMHGRGLATRRGRSRPFPSRR